MDDLYQMIEIEYEKIELIIEGLPDPEKLPYLSDLELAGVATYLHNFFNGLENILKRIFKSYKIEIPSGDSWHMDLLNSAVSNKIITKDLKGMLNKYLGFRHFFIYAYATDLYADKMEKLVDTIKTTFDQFKTEIELFTK